VVYKLASFGLPERRPGGVMRACLFLCAIGLTATVAGAQDISPFYDASAARRCP
jgi:hypothetical protein